MIDAVPVVERRRPPGAIAQPAEVGGADDIPAIRRQSPVLPGLGERVGRRADGSVDVELVLPRPDVGAVAAHHEREVAEHADRTCLAARLLPLLVGKPLQVGVVGNLLPKPLPRVVQRRRNAVADAGVPLAPVTAAVRLEQRAEQRVVAEPPVLPLAKRAEAPIAIAAAAGNCLTKMRERLPQRPPLHRADAGIVDAFRAPHPVEQRQVVAGEHRVLFPVLD